jgi:hypothetical protein
MSATPVVFSFCDATSAEGNRFAGSLPIRSELSIPVFRWSAYENAQIPRILVLA